MKGSVMASSRQPTKARAINKPVDAGAEIRNYQLVERVGQDELALIYSARHQTLERDVYVHVLRRSGQIAVSRFQLAARLAARVQHPNILPVLDAGYDERYGYYMVTPPVQAQPLQRLLDAGPLEPPLAVRIFAQIGQALDELHRQHIVHRDVQPHTILVTADGKAYLTGFSLAWTPDGPDLSQLDEADYLTPYAAPEQTFEDQTPDPALDIYSLGAVLYHMLTGEAPQNVGVEPAALAEQDPRFAPADRILRRMLAPEPQLRYPSAAQAVAALRGALRAMADGDVTAPSDIDADSESGGQWLENPLEIVLRDYIDNDFLARTHARAEELHSGKGVRHLLNIWSNNNPIRRRQVGQMIQIEQIVSYNLYFYDLVVLYETRTHPEQRERPLTTQHTASREPTPDHWDVDVAVPDEPFADVAETEVAIPHSEKIVVCPRCRGTTYLTCPRCQGRGTIDTKRTVRTETGTHVELQTADCSECQGQGQVVCDRCDGEGRLLTTAVFRFSRRGRLWQNTDDFEGLSQRTLEAYSEVVFTGEIDLHDPAWHAVQPLHELINEATKNANDETRIVAHELTIRGTPVTEVDYSFRDKPHTLAIIGFDGDIRGDLSLVDTDRILIWALVVALVIAVAAGVYFNLLQN